MDVRQEMTQYRVTGSCKKPGSRETPAAVPIAETAGKKNGVETALDKCLKDTSCKVALQTVAEAIQSAQKK